METNDSCMDFSTEMECAMADGCEWMMGMCMESMSNQDVNTPHFIVMDETLGYWFVTTIASGYVAQYSLVDNTLIDSYFAITFINSVSDLTFQLILTVSSIETNLSGLEGWDAA